MGFDARDAAGQPLFLAPVFSRCRGEVPYPEQTETETGLHSVEFCSSCLSLACGALVFGFSTRVRVWERGEKKGDRNQIEYGWMG